MRSAYWILPFYFFSVAVSPLAQADLASPSPSPSGVAANCNSFCSMLVNGKGQPVGLDGSSGWGTTDDQWCANHNAQTNPNIMPNASPTSTAPLPNEACNISLQPGDTSCADAQKKYAHCQWHNGQAEQQCQAYVAADGSNGGQKAVLFLDIAAAGTCAASCAMASSGPAATACRAAGLGASAAELVETLTQKGSIVGKAISGAMSGFGIYKEGKALLPSITGGGKNAAAAPAVGADGNTVAPAKSKNDGSCLSALLFAAMTLARYQSISSANDSKKNACDAVQKLASNVSTVGGAAVVSIDSGGNVVSAATGGTTGDSSGADASLRCVGSGGAVSSCTGTNASAATDSGILTSSGLGAQVAPQAAQLANSPLGQALGNGTGDPMAALGAATAGTGDAGSAVMTVAAAALAHPHDMAEGVAGSTLSGGGGGAPSDGGGGDANPMAALAAMLHPGQKDQMPAGGTQTFKSNENIDIWHRNSDQNLFQIVSGRIEKAAVRMR